MVALDRDKRREVVIGTVNILYLEVNILYILWF